MKFTDFFIKHPVIALTINALIILLGVLCFYQLPVSEYPQVSFPSVSVNSFYANASAELMESAVTNILEDNLAGIEGIDSITSFSRQGASFINIDFRPGISMDRALLSIREAIGLARAQLPKDMKEPLVERQVQSNGMPFMAIALDSSTMNFGELTHYANLNLKNTFRSLPGVASVDVWGQPYTYQIKLSPEKMMVFGVNAHDIYEALQKSRLSLPVGKFQNEIPASLSSELHSLLDYENLVIKERQASNGSHKHPPVLLKQVATVQFTTDDSKFRVRINGHQGLAIAINKAKDANPLEVSKEVHNQLRILQKGLPAGLHLQLITDGAEFIHQSMDNIQSSIYEAIIIVLIIVFLFLRNIRASLIPLVTIPISLLGSLLFLKMFGYSINILTLMAMVLAVGLVVDDAIVVLENIQRQMEKGATPLQASLLGAREICFAIMAMTVTLISVYAPLAFITGTVGQLFTEFSVALAGAVFISGAVALTLSPLMCAYTLSQNNSRIWPVIDRLMATLQSRYQAILQQTLFYKKTALTILFLSLLIIGLCSISISHEMAPKEDRGLAWIYTPMVPGTNLDTLEGQVKKIESLIADIPEAKNRLAFMGDWGGFILLPLKDQNLRHRSASEIADSFKPLTAKIPSLEAYPGSWDSALPGLDSNNKQELSMVISTTDDYRKLYNHSNKARVALEKTGQFQQVHHDLKMDTASYRIDLDTNAMSNLNLDAGQIAKTIEIFFSGDQSLPFSKDGILYYLNMGGEKSPWTLNELYITNSSAKRISLGAVARLVSTTGPDQLYHYNQMRSVNMSANLGEQQKLDKAMPAFWNKISAQLPTGYKKTWVGAAKAYLNTKSSTALLFLLALVFIFAILAMQFENFIDPFIILFTVPLACSGALLVVLVCGQSLNIYTQVGLITLIGLITKHGILMVEFANQLAYQGMARQEAILQASIQRLRPILMTTAAMIVGSIPLVISHQAGFEARRAIGSILIGGLAFGTVFTLFVLPTMYLIVKGALKKT